jgi:hypothetical protein
MNDPEGDKVCYITMFTHGQPSDDGELIIIGNLFLEKYYLVYDMSPLEQA